MKFTLFTPKQTCHLRVLGFLLASAYGGRGDNDHTFLRQNCPIIENAYCLGVQKK